MYLPARPLDREAALLEQLVDQVELLDTVYGKAPVTLAIFVRFQEIKLILPKPDQRLGNLKHLGHLADAVVALEVFLIFVEDGQLFHGEMW